MVVKEKKKSTWVWLKILVGLYKQVQLFINLRAEVRAGEVSEHERVKIDECREGRRIVEVNLEVLHPS